MAQAHATIACVKGLVQALQAIKMNHKLPCAVTFEAAAGLSLRFLDAGHAMQSGISLSAAVSQAGALADPLGVHEPTAAVGGTRGPTPLPLTPPGVLALPGAAQPHAVCAAQRAAGGDQHGGIQHAAGAAPAVSGAGQLAAAYVRHRARAGGRMAPCALQATPLTAAAAPPPPCRRTTEDASARTSICSYAKVATLAQQDMSSLDDMWEPQEASSQAIVSGASRARAEAQLLARRRELPTLWCRVARAAGLLLREAIEDLEWTGGEVEFVMRHSPVHFSLQSIRQQSLEVGWRVQLGLCLASLLRQSLRRLGTSPRLAAATVASTAWHLASPRR